MVYPDALPGTPPKPWSPVHMRIPAACTTFVGNRLAVIQGLELSIIRYTIRRK
jgi:hypothetical protein